MQNLPGNNQVDAAHGQGHANDVLPVQRFPKEGQAHQTGQQQRPARMAGEATDTGAPAPKVK